MSSSDPPPLVESHITRPKKVPRKVPIPLASDDQAGPDAAAVAEARALGRDELEKQARHNHHVRKEKAKDHFTKAMFLAGWGGFAFGGIIIAVWLFHFIFSAKWLWLNDMQLETLKHIIVVCAASMGGYMFKSFRHYVEG